MARLQASRLYAPTHTNRTSAMLKAKIAPPQKVATWERRPPWASRQYPYRSMASPVTRGDTNRLAPGNGEDRNIRVGQITLVRTPANPPDSATPNPATTGCVRRRCRSDAPMVPSPSSMRPSAPICRTISQIAANTNSAMISIGNSHVVRARSKADAPGASQPRGPLLPRSGRPVRSRRRASEASSVTMCPCRNRLPGSAGCSP